MLGFDVHFDQGVQKCQILRSYKFQWLVSMMEILIRSFANSLGIQVGFKLPADPPVTLR